ncbi:LysR family transcriptional regulator [Paraburkholderia sp. BCC1886]|uniref:LysR family transcriptional regulator n=1 Tax=Paraburkholderia sp. BCC1886 TaxID=2562670 RepID=UPI0011831913|nr:LysR family transcriptional regulator [Paraburkholderia sp. BCC1886]
MREINEMTIFVEVAARGTLSAAARGLGLATSVVSERIAALEKRLGVRLVARTTRQQALTDVGRTYLEHCHLILAQLAEAERAVANHRDEPSGVLRVTAPTPLGRRRIAPLLAGFIAKHPDIRVELVLTDEYADLVAEGFDIAIRGGPIPDSSLVGHVLGLSRRVVVASPDYLKRGLALATPADLCRHACLVHNADASRRAAWRFGKGNAARVVRVEGALASNNSELPVEWARAGLGVAQKSWWEVAAAVHAGELSTVLEAFEPDDVPFVALHHGQSTRSKKIQLFLAYLVADFEARPLSAP